MVNQQLLDYIERQLAQGVAKDVISSNLLSQSWQTSDIEEAFNLVGSSKSPSSPQNNTSQPFSAPSQQPSKGINKSLLTVISIIGLMVISGGVFGYFYHSQESPEKIIQKMVERIAAVRSLEYQGEIESEVATPDFFGGSGDLPKSTQTEPNKQTSYSSINFSGKSDISNLNNPKSSFAFNIRTDALKGLLTEEDFVFGFELRGIGQFFYLRLGNIPDFRFFELSFLSDNWIKIDIESLKKQLGPEGLEEQIKEAQKQQELTPEQIEGLVGVVSVAKVLKVTDKLPSEKIDSVETYHYKFVVDRDNLIKLIADVNSIIQDKTLTENEIADLNKSLEIIESFAGEIWIGKEDLLPYKVSLETLIKETDKSKTSGKLTLVTLFKNYNKPVQIDIPSPVKDLEEFLGELFGEFPSGEQL